MKNQHVTAAVVQAAPVVFDVNRTLEKMRDLAADAARRSADIVVFPEAFLSAYPKGLDFGARHIVLHWINVWAGRQLAW